MMGTGADLPGRPHRRLPPQDARRRRASAPASSASSPARSRKWPTPASATPSPRTRARTAQALPGFKPAQPVVFCGLFPVDAADFEDLRAAIGQPAPQRRQLLLRDGDLRRARLRLPLRLPRPAAPRDHPGAAGARVRPRPHRHRALGRLPHPADATARSSELHNPADMPDVVKIAAIEEPWIRATILTPDDYLGAILKLCQDRRGIQADLSYVGKRAMVDLRPAAQRGRVRLLRPAEVDLQGLRLVRLPPHRLPRGRPRQDVDPGQRRAGRRAVDAGPPRARPKSAAAPCARS